MFFRLLYRIRTCSRYLDIHEEVPLRRQEQSKSAEYKVPRATNIQGEDDWLHYQYAEQMSTNPQRQDIDAGNIGERLDLIQAQYQPVQ